MASKTKCVLTEVSKYKVHKLHETYLKEEFSCIYKKFLLRQVRQNTFSRSVENNVKSKDFVTENIHTESYLSEKSVRCFFDCVCKWRVQMACTCLAAMFLASKCTCAV